MRMGKVDFDFSEVVRVGRRHLQFFYLREFHAREKVPPRKKRAVKVVLVVYIPSRKRKPPLREEGRPMPIKERALFFFFFSSFDAKL